MFSVFTQLQSAMYHLKMFTKDHNTTVTSVTQCTSNCGRLFRKADLMRDIHKYFYLKTEAQLIIKNLHSHAEPPCTPDRPLGQKYSTVRMVNGKLRSVNKLLLVSINPLILQTNIHSVKLYFSILNNHNRYSHNVWVLL